MANPFEDKVVSALRTALAGLPFKERREQVIPPELVKQLPAVIWWLDRDHRIGQRAGQMDHWELVVHIVVVCHPRAEAATKRSRMRALVQNALESSLSIEGAEIELEDEWDFFGHPEKEPTKNGAVTTLRVRRWVETANHPSGD